MLPITNLYDSAFRLQYVMTWNENKEFAFGINYNHLRILYLYLDKIVHRCNLYNFWSRNNSPWYIFSSKILWSCMGILQSLLKIFCLLSDTIARKSIKSCWQLWHNLAVSIAQMLGLYLPLPMGLHGWIVLEEGIRVKW